MKREAIDYLNKALLWLKQHQKPTLPQRCVKVNLGSGLVVADGWINVDSSLNALLSKWPEAFARAFYGLSEAKTWYSLEQYLFLLKNHRFVHHDLGYRLPFPDNTIDCLYSSHTLEHLFRVEAERLLKEVFRCMKQGGRIRICVPDLAHAFELYRVGSREAALELFFTSSKTGYYSRHQYLYDYELLSILLENVGFVEIERCGYRKGQVPDIGILDNRPEQTLFVEAIKPQA